MRAITLALLLDACASAPRPAPPPSGALAALAWLRGTWCGPMGDGTFCESWREGGDGALEGAGELRVGGVRREGERLRIEARGAEVYYVAAPGDAAPTSFRLVRWSVGEAVFENPAHDFPTRIGYARRGVDGLTAVVENNARRLTFALTRQGR